MTSDKSSLNVVQVLPGGMKFESRAASSVELCVSDWIDGSSFRSSTTLVAERSDEAPLLDGIAIQRVVSPRRLRGLHQAWSVRRHIARAADVIVTQQYIPTAALVARLSHGTPVVLQTHNFLPSPHDGRGAFLKNLRLRAQLNALSGITFVSDSTQTRFRQEWPEVKTPGVVVNNGFDFDRWHPARERTRNIMVVGRCEPEKGILEAAQGCAAFLARHADWRATFILSATEWLPDYVAQVKQALAPFAAQVDILDKVPFARVKALTEEAALVVVASRWIEPFGRTALEAHAGGAALISSGTGGLREISGDNAIYLPEVSGNAIAAELEILAADSDRCADLAARALARARQLFSLRDAVCPRLDNFLERVARGQA